MTSSGLPRQPAPRLNLWLVALALVLPTGCHEEEAWLSIDPMADFQEEGVWLSIDPDQCLGNPWDQDWLLTHDVDDYPQTQSGQVAIFRDYYTGQGLAIHDVRVEQFADEVCAACACPTGERYFILVDEADEGAFLDLGFVRDDG